MIAKWAVLTWCGISALIVVAGIGKPRKPTTPGVAVLTLVIIGAEAATIWIWWRT